MRVALRHPSGRVAEDVLDFPEEQPAPEHLRRGRVPEVVEADVRELGLGSHRLPEAADPFPLLARAAAREDQASRLLALAVAERVEELQRRLRQLEPAIGTVLLAPDPHDVVVDVGPGEREDLTEPCTGLERQAHDDLALALVGASQGGAGASGGEDSGYLLLGKEDGFTGRLRLAERHPIAEPVAREERLGLPSCGEMEGVPKYRDLAVDRRVRLALGAAPRHVTIERSHVDLFDRKRHAEDAEHLPKHFAAPARGLGLHPLEPLEVDLGELRDRPLRPLRTLEVLPFDDLRLDLRLDPLGGAERLAGRLPDDPAVAGAEADVPESLVGAALDQPGHEESRLQPRKRSRVALMRITHQNICVILDEIKASDKPARRFEPERLDPMAKEILQAFGTRLKERRKEKGWTQKELAAKIGVQFSLLNKYEGGLHAPPLDKLVELAEVLDTSVDYLLTGDRAEAVPIRSTRLLERFRELEGFSNEDRETVLKLIDAMIVKRRVEGALSTVRGR